VHAVPHVIDSFAAQGTNQLCLVVGVRHQSLFS
jgi:hypothetical protein